MSLSFIVAMAWKSAVISGAALLLVALLRKRAAADRAALLRVGVLLLLLLPLVSLLLPALTIETAPAAGPVAVPAMTAAELAALAASMPKEPGSSWLEGDRLAALAYLAGVLLIALRLGAGLLTLRRWTRSGGQVASPEWIGALERQALKGRVLPLLIASDRVGSPLSWGLRRPVILLDRESLERTADADAVLAHEMAHVERRDWLSLVLARAAVALFWFNPLVWLLERQVLQSAEEAADSHALEQVEAIRYAEALVSCAQRCGRSSVPANSIARSGGGLARRVKAVLEGKGRGAPSGSSWTAAAMIGCIGLAAPVAALQLVPAPPPAPKAPPAPVARLAPPALPAPAAPPAAVAAVPPGLVVAPEAPSIPVAAVQVAAAVRAPAVPAPPVPPASPRQGEELDEEASERVAEAVERAVEQAERNAERIAERAERDAERIAERAERDAERIAANAERAAAKAMRSARAAHSAGADAMLSGANAMEAGARQMDEAARNLGSREFREREIAKAAARGKRVTHEELIGAIPEMRRGAGEMRQGAKEMRSGAAEMRRQGI